MEELTPNSQMNLQKHKKPVGIWILLTLLLVALGVIGWFVWMYLNWNTQRLALETDKRALLEEVKALKNQLANDTTDSPPADACDPTVTATLKENIGAAVESQNYAALVSSMASSVNVILAASDGVGPRTPEQAVEDMAYLNQGTSPWDFSLAAATIAAWDGGSYTDYFDENTYVGRAANGMVVVFDFDNCGKISEIFMVANEELLS
ncbi:MAG TPA: hypothetical protein VFT87_00570 [Candidatus Saccharimonadales bacterium]|nr:hypothetical protein [Candidatus Saccharimonadales bacterium]